MLGAEQLLMKCGQMARKNTALTSSRLLFLLAAMHRPPDARHYNTDKHHNIKISQYKIFKYRPDIIEVIRKQLNKRSVRPVLLNSLSVAE